MTADRTARRALRVALICVDPWQHEDSDDIRPFNYGVRRIQAAILGHPELDTCELALLESSTLDANDLAERIEVFDPDIVGASAYVWSFPTLLEACRLAKRARPERTVVFGGPSSRPEMCELPQHSDASEVIDALVVSEGEACIQDILRAPARERRHLLTIPGLAVHDGDSWILTGEVDVGAPDRYPSPYQMGLMPSGITCEIESFRGCPLSCTFCEWGDTGSTGRTFGLDYLVRELAALQSLDAKGSWLVDAGLNLNSRAFRNLQRAEREVGTLQALGDFRCEIYPSHMADEHLRFLEDTSAVYAGIGLQSFDPQVLKAVRRKFSEDRFDRVVREVGAIVPEATVEVMMGLPGDNPDNFKRTLDKVRKLPVNVRVFHTLVLPGALMTKAPESFELTYDPFDLRVLSCRGWSRGDIEATCRWLDDEVRDSSGEPPGTWRFFRQDRRDRFGRGGPESAVPEVAVDRAASGGRGAPMGGDRAADIREAVARHARAVGWEISSLRVVDGDVRNGLLLGARASFGSLDLRVAPVRPGARFFREVDGVAYSYERQSGLDGNLGALDVLIARLHPLMRATLLGLSRTAKRRPGGLPVLPSG